MATIFLIRHGEVSGNSGRLTFAGWNDVPLTQRGKWQAELCALLQNENLNAVYSSDLSRARDTAKIIAAPHDLKVQENAVWREVDFGDWNGCGERELLANWPDLWAQRTANALDVRPPNGENLRDLQARMQPAWQTLVGQMPDEQKVALVTHQNMMRAIVCEILGAPLENYRALHISNASVSRVEVKAGRVALASLNEVAHLSAIK